MSRHTRVLWFTGAAVLGVVGYAIPYVGGVDPDPLAHAVNVLSREAFVLAGILAMMHRPGNRVGSLMIITGVVWMAPVIQALPSSFTATLGELLTSAHWIVLAHLTLVFPSGRGESRAQRLTIGAFYMYAIPNAFGSLPFFDPRVECPGCPPNLVLIAHRPEWEAPILLTVGSIGAALALVVATLLFVKWRRASRRARRAIVPVMVSAIPVIAVGVWDGLSTLPLPGLSDLAIAALPIGFLMGLLRARLDRFAVGDLVLELSRGASGPELRNALARALRDPSVELAYWLPERSAFVDPQGRRAELPLADSRRSATVIESDGEPLAALIHDASLRDETELVASVGAAARLALENERLQAKVRSQLEEVRASRTRIVDATDAERRRLERDLHDGAQQRLVNLSLAIRMAQEKAGDGGALGPALEEAADEVRAALSELREFARGLHPAILSEAGLGPALESLAERSSMPVRVLGASSERFPRAVEAAGYFVVSEALANAAKHSGGSSVTVTMERRGGALVLEVQDDGRGGADPTLGSGLAGLEDRVAALDGRLQVESPRGGGTRVIAELPCG